MSVIVRDDKGKLLLLCKGADRLVKFEVLLPQIVIQFFFLLLSCLSAHH